ncbi:TPA: hypothetical protein ACGO1N_000867, partial [Streptococcus suis]
GKGERSSFRSDADRTLFLLYFKGTGCQAPLELDTHQIKSTTFDLYSRMNWLSDKELRRRLY